MNTPQQVELTVKIDKPSITHLVMSAVISAVVFLAIKKYIFNS